MIREEGQIPEVNELVTLAKEAGFSNAAPLAMDGVTCRLCPSCTYSGNCELL